MSDQKYIEFFLTISNKWSCRARPKCAGPSLGFGPLTRALFGRDNPSAPLYTVMLGGLSLLTAAVCVTFVQDNEREVPVDAVLEGDREEHFTAQETLQPVPSSGRPRRA